MNVGFFSQSYEAKWGRTPKIQAQAEKEAGEAMTESFVEQIKAHAQRDAKKGIYMDQPYIQMTLNHMRETVSPNRKGLIAQAAPLLRAAEDSQDPLWQAYERMMDKLSGKEYSIKVQGGRVGQTAEIYSPDGEMIAGYNSLGSGWTEIQTKAESKFLDNATVVYAEAYRQARAGLKAAAQEDSQPAYTLDVQA